MKIWRESRKSSKLATCIMHVFYGAISIEYETRGSFRGNASGIAPSAFALSLNRPKRTRDRRKEHAGRVLTLEISRASTSFVSASQAHKRLNGDALALFDEPARRESLSMDFRCVEGAGCVAAHERRSRRLDKCKLLGELRVTLGAGLRRRCRLRRGMRMARG